jgi:hypothetical protein
MRKNILKSLIAGLALAILVMPVLADTMIKHVEITGTHNIAGKEMKADLYTFKVDDTKVVVELRNKLVGEATGRWEPCEIKHSSTSVVAAEDGTIHELRFAGEKRTFIIGSK